MRVGMGAVMGNLPQTLDGVGDTVGTPAEHVRD